MDDETLHAAQLVRSILDLSDNLKKATVDLFYEVGLNTSAAEAVVQWYTKGNDDDLAEAFYEILADLLVTCPVRDMSRLLTSVSGNRVFRYVISSAIAGPAASSDDMLRLLFGVPFRRPLEHDAMRVTSQQVISRWTHFARTGQISDVSELVYGRYSFNVTRASEFNADVLDARKEYCNFLRSVIT
ncbi:acetylcholinesterase-like [Amblyomma americanum]